MTRFGSRTVHTFEFHDNTDELRVRCIAGYFVVIYFNRSGPVGTGRSSSLEAAIAAASISAMDASGHEERKAKLMLQDWHQHQA